jgi:hypothetical protein
MYNFPFERNNAHSIEEQGAENGNKDKGSHTAVSDVGSGLLGLRGIPKYTQTRQR